VIVIDSSLWIAIYRDLTGQIGAHIAARVGQEPVSMLRPISMEVLQGTRDENEGAKLSAEIGKLPSVKLPDDVWEQAARLYFDLRRDGKTIRSSIDCLIAQTCLVENCTLLHNDRDFEAIATVRPLKHLRIDVSKATP
jgi:predicted nucleic acid-binding protein